MAESFPAVTMAPIKECPLSLFSLYQNLTVEKLTLEKFCRNSPQSLLAKVIASFMNTIAITRHFKYMKLVRTS